MFSDQEKAAIVQEYIRTDSVTAVQRFVRRNMLKRPLHRKASADGTSGSYRLEVCGIYRALEDHEQVKRRSMLFDNYILQSLVQAYAMRKLSYRYHAQLYRKF